MSSHRRIFWVALVAFGLHFMWESAHVGLYTGYEHVTELPITLYATFGDVVYVLFGVALLSFLKRSGAWMISPSTKEYCTLAFIGLLIALFVEYKGLTLGKWVYTSAMPLVPFLGVGVSPLVQMTLLLPLSVWVGIRLARMVD